MSIDASGDQYDINHGRQHATLVEVGGGIRTYTVGGHPVLAGYPRHQICDDARGAPLIPWPHRLEGGRYRFNGNEHQLALTEPLAGNAIHGLTRWARGSLRELSDHHVALGYLLPPQPGYPFALHLAITYQLDQQGLTVATTATNFGDTPCPYGHGQYISLTATTGTSDNDGSDNQNVIIDDCALRLDAARVLMLDDRGLPTRSDYVIGSRFDFRHPRRIGTTVIDNVYTALARDTAGRSWVHLCSPDGPKGRTVSLWMDHHYRYIALHTSDTPPPERRRRGLGVTPMACGPNGFATGEDLIALEPGQSVSTQWGIHTHDTRSRFDLL